MLSARDEVNIKFARRYRSSIGVWEKGDEVRLSLEDLCFINRDSPGTFGERESTELTIIDRHLRESPQELADYAFLHEDTATPIDLAHPEPPAIGTAHPERPDEPRQLTLEEALNTVNPEPEETDEEDSEDDTEGKQDASKDDPKTRSPKVPGSNRQVKSANSR